MSDAESRDERRRAMREATERLKASGALDELFARVDAGEVELDGHDGLIPRRRRHDVLATSTTTSTTAPPKPSTAAWKPCAATHSDSATSPTTESDSYCTAATSSDRSMHSETGRARKLPCTQGAKGGGSVADNGASCGGERCIRRAWPARHGRYPVAAPRVRPWHGLRNRKRPTSPVRGPQMPAEG